ncbi:hypothetical protein BDFB_002370, partial [Asbolus verrucosus]
MTTLLQTLVTDLIASRTLREKRQTLHQKQKPLIMKISLVITSRVAFVWQHVQCVVKNKQVPEEYLCEVCDPHKHIDRQKARLAQQQWLRDRQFADPKLRKDPKLKEVFKQKETLSDSDTSDGEHPGHNNNIVGKGRPTLVNRRKSDSHQKGAAKQRRDSAKEVVQRRPVKKRERKVVKRK